MAFIDNNSDLIQSCYYQNTAFKIMDPNIMYDVVEKFFEQSRFVMEYLDDFYG